MGCQHAEIAVAVRVRWRHQLGDTVDLLRRREGDLSGVCTALVVGVAAGLAVLLGAAVDPLTARLAQPACTA